jgi:hypothetical protein
MNIRRRWLMLLAALPLLSACKEGKEDGDLPTPPLILPFEVQKAGNKVETPLKIVKQREYIFSLLFSYKKGDEIDRARVRKLTGGYEVVKSGKVMEPGIPTPVKLRVIAIEATGEKLVYEKETDPILTSWGGDSFAKNIAYVVLQPGDYRIRVESLKDAPELAGTFIAIGIGYYHKP